MKYPEVFEQLIDSLKKLPGVGGKSAERMAYQILNMRQEDLNLFSKSLLEVKQKLKTCPQCGCMCQDDLCEICKDEGRDTSVICVVQNTKDVYALEKSKAYNGTYHVLGGVISATNGVMIHDLNFNTLIERVKNNEVKELILATNPTAEGNTTALYIVKLLENHQLEVMITRLASGLPVGGNLDYADEFTIINAMQGRRKI